MQYRNRLRFVTVNTSGEAFRDYRKKLTTFGKESESWARRHPDECFPLSDPPPDEPPQVYIVKDLEIRVLFPPRVYGSGYNILLDELRRDGWVAWMQHICSKPLFHCEIIRDFVDAAIHLRIPAMPPNTK